MDYDKLPETIDALENGSTVVFSTTQDDTNVENSNKGVDFKVILIVGIIIVVAVVIILVKTGCLKKLTSMFMVVAMVAGLGSSLSVTAEAATDEFSVKGSKTITYAGEEKTILVSADITVEYEGENEADELPISGTELAKILLANERLDSKKLTDDSKLFTTAGIKDSVSRLNYVVLSTADTSEYAENSNMMDYFNSYIVSVNSVAQSTADTIDYVKENIGCTGVWIDYGGLAGETLLDVTENEELLFINADVFSFVCRRYTDNNGNEVYEMCQTEEDGSYLYLRFIPDNLYEYSSYLANGQDIHVIAENSRGYWNMFTTYTVEEGRRNVQNLVAAEDFAYVYDGCILTEGYVSNNYITFVEPSLKCDLIAVYEYDMDIKLVGFDGIVSMEVDGDNFITSFTTKNGDVINVGDEIAEGLTYKYGNVNYSETPYANLDFSGTDVMNGATATAIIEALADMGVTCKYDLTAVLSGVDASYAIANNFGSYYSWNGYYVKDYAAVDSAISVDKGKYASLMSSYETALEARKIEITSTGINYKDYDFAKLTLTGSEAATFENGVVTISGLAGEVAAAAVMMNDESYELRFALARITETDGEYDSAILLPSESNGSAKYAGTALSLTKSATVTIPDCKQTGDYKLVAYAATSEGIRVSKMVPVTFTDAVSYSTVVDGFETSVELNDNGELLVCYTPMNEYEATMPEATSYTYDDVYEFLSTEVMKYGYPNTEAKLEVYDAETGEVIEASSGDTLSGCICKLQYDIPDANGLVIGYVYVQLP